MTYRIRLLLPRHKGLVNPWEFTLCFLDMIEGRCSPQDRQSGFDGTKNMPVAKLVLSEGEDGSACIDLRPVLVRESKGHINVPLVAYSTEELCEVTLHPSLLTARGLYKEVCQWQT